MRWIFIIPGIAILAAAWIGPLPRLAGEAFWAHMTMHVAVVAAAAPCLALSIAGGRFDPVARLPWLFAPIPASLVELAVVWAWHAPSLHHAARGGAGGLAAEQAMFLTVAVWVWLSSFGGDALQGTHRAASGVFALLLTSMHMTLLGALLAMSPRPLFEHASSSHLAHGGLDPLTDLHLGGAIMLLVGGLSYLIGGLWLTSLILRRKRSADRFQAKEGAL